MNAYRTAYVYVGAEFAGTLSETDSGYSFAYDKTYLSKSSSTHVSLTLPLRKEAYASPYLFPFFDGLIPEGWLLETVERNWKVDSKDRFGLLLVTCKDCIGNISVFEEKQ